MIKKIYILCWLIAICYNLPNANASLKKAIEYYQDDDFYNAAIQFDQVKHALPKGEINDKATIFLANSLFNLELYSYAIVVLTDIINRGDKSTYYVPALEKALYLNRFLKGNSLPYVLSKIPPTAYPYILTDQISYIVGEYLTAKGKFDDALKLLVLIPEQSNYFSRAQYLMGIINYQKGNVKHGIELLRDLIEIHGFQGNIQLEDQTYLALARIFYSLGRFEKAVELYEAIPKNSGQWPLSLTEVTWALFLSGNFNKALGNLHALYSTYFENNLLYEVNVIEATIYYDLCMDDFASYSIDNYHKVHDPIITELDNVNNRYSTNSKELGEKLKTERLQQYFSPIITKYLEENQRMETLRKYLHELYNQKKILDSSLPSFRDSNLGKSIDSFLGNEISNKEIELGEIAIEILKDLQRDLKNYQLEVDLVKFEILRRQKKELEATLMEDEFTTKIASQLEKYKEFKGLKIFLKQNQYYWPFEGEYWADELSDYIFSLNSACKI